MRIAVIGAGYVGLVSGVCFSEFGIEVVCVDNDFKKIESLRNGETPIYEPELDTLLANNVRANRLSFSNDIESSIAGVDAIFIAVGTPSRRGDGHADLTHVYEVISEIGKMICDYTVIVTKSTVPVGTGDNVEKMLKELKPKTEFDVVSNPEFLREGSAINDFMHPDRVVIGVNSEKAKEVMRQIYRPLFLLETPIMFTNRSTAELIKYAGNTFLATKITFINEIADFCEKVGADVNDVARGIGLDRRIGSKFLHAGPGYGGSCFPKDTLALVKTAELVGSPLQIVQTVVNVNEKRKKGLIDRVKKILRGKIKGKTISVLGVTFKPNTDDIRESPSLELIPAMISSGAIVNAFDPQGMEQAKSLINNVNWHKDVYDSIHGSDLLIILTEWNEFRALDLGRIKNEMRFPVILDFRNIYEIDEMRNAGIVYHCIGREGIAEEDI